MAGRPRIYITGVGMLSAVGDDPASLYEAVNSGDTSRTRVLDHLPAEHFRARLAVDIPEFLPQNALGKKLAREVDRAGAMGLVAADAAMADADWKPGEVDPETFGVVTGTAFGGIPTALHECTESFTPARASDRFRLSPLVVLRCMASGPAYVLADRFGARGPTCTVSTACSSGAHALAVASDQLRLGRAERILVVASDSALDPMNLAAWQRLGVMSVRTDSPGDAYRPFDVERGGFVMGEGSAAFLLETERAARVRGAPAKAELLGYAFNVSTEGLTSPSRPTQRRVLELALEDAALRPDQVSLVMAHGSGTRRNDPTEAGALSDVFGDGPTAPLVLSSKPVVGHTMGVCGGLELLVGMEAFSRGRVPAIPNLRQKDQSCPIRAAAPGGEEVRGSVGVIQTLAFGGCNVVLVFDGTPAP